MDWFEKLKVAIIIINTKGEIRQPQNYAMERVSKGYSRWHTAQHYIYDIERILREMRVAVSFVSQLPNEEFLSSHSISQEDYILYHQGYFLDLTHQLKDKLCQLVRVVVTPESDYAGKKLENSTKLSKLLRDKYALKVPGLVELLREWDDSGSNGTIAKALKKRTHYHHKKNPLSRIDSYVQVYSLRSLLDPKFTSSISEYGKQVLSKKVEQGLIKWQTVGFSKMQETLDAINSNLNSLAKILVQYYKFPNFGNSAHLVNWNLRLYEKSKVKKSSYNENSIHPACKPATEVIKQMLPDILGNNLSAIYITGSVLRSDYLPGLSNINVVVIVKDNDQKRELIVKFLLLELSKEIGTFIETNIVAEETFLKSSELEKLRFICKTDGFLLFGKDLLKDEKDLKICFKLAWMLNKDFKKFLSDFKKRLENPSFNPSILKMSVMVRSLARRAYWMSFSQVMGNNVLYTSNFKEMRRLQNYYYPRNRKFNESIYRMLAFRIKSDKDTLLYFVKKCEESLLPLYETMEKYCDDKNPQLIIKSSDNQD